MSSTNQDTENSSDSTLLNKGMRDQIARLITKTVPRATMVLGISALGLAIGFIVLGDLDGAFRVIQYVFTALLPLWGTWVGTVLAFYFTKENFQAATENAQKMMEQLSPREKLQSLNVLDIMISYDQLKKADLNNDEVPEEIKLSDVKSSIKTNGIKRWPIFKEGVYQYILHLATIDKFLMEQVEENIAPDGLKSLTIASMATSNDPEILQILKDAARFVPKSATLYDAKTAMDQSHTCNDVFVTESGQKEEKVLGWISNVDIIKHGSY